MGLATDNRLRRPAEFRRVLSRGQRAGGKAGDRFLLISAIPGEGSRSRIGLAVSKRVGGSVTRNRVKRRLREIFRESVVRSNVDGEAAWDIVVTARPPAAEATYMELQNSVARLVSKLITRTGRNR